MKGPLGIFSVLRHRSLAAVWFAGLVSQIGDWAARIALAVLVLDRTGSASLSALVLVVSVLPWVGPGQVVATWLAHLPRTRVLVVSDLLRGGIYALLLLRLPVLAVLGLVFLAALATPPFDAARSALTIDIVPEADYGSAITLLDLSDQASIMVGYLAGGLSVAAGGVHVAILADVISYVVSAAAVSFVREPPGGRTVSEPVGPQLRRALRIIRSDEIIRRGVAEFMVAPVTVAAIEGTAAAYSQFALHAGARTAGELAAAVPVGILISVPFLPRTGTPRRLLRVGAVTGMVSGFIGAAAFAGGHEIGAFVGYLAAGALTGSCTPMQIAFQPQIPRDDRAGVISLLFGLLRGGEALGAAGGGLLIVAIGAQQAAIFWMALAAIGAASFLLRPLPHRHATRRGREVVPDPLDVPVGSDPVGPSLSGESPL